MTDSPERGKRILYGRRRGKPLRKGQQVLIDRDLPRLRVALRETPVDLADL
ncbi:MAG: tRNA (guanosine(46)-N7)-methyltransferase TrmB, partial [Alphaproteobacteria bacterium]